MKATLSHSEFEIAERLALGESKKEVADKTNRSVFTVETTVKNIYQKLGFNKLSDLVLWYCGQTFNISLQISERKKQVLSIILLVLFISFECASDNSYCRVRRSGRRKGDSELCEADAELYMESEI